MGELLMGTSGYDYKEWKGVFYPEKLAQAKFLEYYATQFNSLELNGTFYRMPTAEQMRRMIERSEGKVQFTVKAFQDLTHKWDNSNYQIYKSGGTCYFCRRQKERNIGNFINSGRGIPQEKGTAQSS
ncbi:MAG: DUF72 domain-containing protein [Treponema sp.]|jgi:uncharacterized protein YecE (DUF72 family)|nr:DUF72 domain-containing protein [Treponema sp.]